MEVTTTTTRAGKFDARFYHMIFEEEIGRVKGHFGPINSLAFHPDGKRYQQSNVSCVGYHVVCLVVTAVEERMGMYVYTTLTNHILTSNLNISYCLLNKLL